MSTDKHTGGIDLEGAAELWQTPAVDSFRSRGGDRKDEMGLDQQAKARVLFPSPAARDYRSESGRVATMNHFNRPAGPSLPAMIKYSFHPDQPTGTPGQPSSEKGPTSRRRLNVKFVEWLMGMPENWVSAEPINCAPWVTQSSRYVAQLLSHYYCNEQRKGVPNER